MADPPPPPPPLPPPPPPPPPPPQPPALNSGGNLLSRGSRRSSRMRNFNWEAIPQDTVLGKHNIWTVEKKKEYELDTKRMEELFSRNDLTDKRPASVRRSIKGTQSKGQKLQGPEVVSILNAKKNMNVGIFLKQFRRSVKELIEDICLGKSEGFGSGKLEELLKLLPDSGEVKKLLAYKGDYSSLSEADQFMVQLVKVPCYEERLKSLVLKEEFPHFMDEVNHCIAIMTAAGKELLDCLDLHSIIRLVLKTGNYMNADGYAGSAVGFRMTSLLKLADTKANKPGMNLMHYVVMQAQKSDAALLKFPEQLAHIGEASRIHKQDIESEFQRKVSEVQELKKNTDKQSDLAEQMKDFFECAESRIAETKASFQTLNALTESVAEYFCEEASDFKLDECCSIFHSFCERFKRALQENTERDLAEVKRRQREKLQAATKRRSTATCSMRDKDMEGVALECVLQRFLTNRGSHRQGRTPSPTGIKLSEITSQENCPAKNSKKPNWTLNPSQTSVDKENMEDTASKKSESKISSPTWKKPASSTPAANRASTTLAASEDVDSQTEEEAQKLREVSQKVLRYQSSRSSISSGEYFSPVSSPRRRVFQEDKEKTLSNSNVEDVPKPPASQLVLIQKSPGSISRRHSISIPTRASQGSDSEEDMFVPSSEVNGSPRGQIVSLGNIGKMRSVDGCLLSTKARLGSETTGNVSNNISNNMPADVPKESSKEVSSPAVSSKVEAKEKTEESSTKSKVSQKQTKESSRFISFFRRLGEKAKTNNREAESSSVDP
ncbi:FH2 domain-containing protein 1 isoform X1 [Colossoma macropomum]|uniref:FH2 domain-containing protein 1 isoform X1 n=1 Tax=Colossoma macropomum TaxID=42526 RepID=UPI001863EFB7|nr:FH2 domain-containing protein 1 isoform X1 [Colossoma macropomum]XP_036420940.1 FH2 domain-containing protein 1 isoform X1 [Colossoma macropomum]